jgi:hypothetical protein
VKIRRALVAGLAVAFSATALAGHTNNIMITGYWPNTNEMVRQFSTNPDQNPTGWVGGNWEGRGYNIHSFFPEFPGGPGQNPRGVGDFEVDYQDTSNDWWRIVDEVDPIAIITFSRGNNDNSWEIESRTRNWANGNWISDYLAPFRPTPELPIFNEPVGNRNSSLPMNAIRDAVNGAGLGLNSYIDTSNNYGGQFLSNYIGYHGSWYRDLHADPSDPTWAIAAGHIHVGIQVTVEQGRSATEISLRQLIDYVNTIVPEPTSALLLLAVAGGLRRRGL